MKRASVAILAILAVLLTVIVGVAAPANAGTGTNIDGWNPSSACLNSSYLYCLWFHPGQHTGGAGWGSTAMSTSPITGTFFIGCPGQAGCGQAVRNNAASMSNGTTFCNVTTWVSPNPGNMGDWNWLDPSWGGDLTPSLRNNEAVISANNCIRN